MDRLESQILEVIASIRDFVSGILLIVLLVRKGNIVGLATTIVAGGPGLMF